MKLANTHISYCTNIHGGESWKDHFDQLKNSLPNIKQTVSPRQSFGLGLRLSAQAASELSDPEVLKEWKNWLNEHDLYVFTLNGFPFGDFHLKAVKDKVHFPDWTTTERLEYTKKLIDVLAQLLNEDCSGGISTSPLSYRYWFDENTAEWKSMREKSTNNIIQIADYLWQQEQQHARYIHLDIEPEPDGVLEDGREFIAWYQTELLEQAYPYFEQKYGFDKAHTLSLITRYICICYDVCHFALEYENHQAIIHELTSLGIQIGKFQISAALKLHLLEDPADRKKKKLILEEFDEPIYLHQVIAKTKANTLVKYRDLPQALEKIDQMDQIEWRSHFHVPIFLESYGEISSTQSDIIEVLNLQKESPRTNHIEVETYTWNVLPKALQIPIEDSISREINWLLDHLKK
ncbi:MAG: metabolite traffic protein EboE [Sphingobacterium sp.]